MSALDAPYPALDDIITDTDLGNYHGSREVLKRSIEASVKAKHSGNEISKRLAGVFGELAVRNYVTALRMRNTARIALAEIVRSGDVQVYATGPDSPVGAWVALAADPSLTPPEQYEALPQAIRRALAPYLLTTDPAVDPNLLDGQAVLIRKIKARSVAGS